MNKSFFLSGESSALNISNHVAKRGASLLKLAALCGGLWMGAGQAQAAPFTPGNLVIYRVGTGAAALVAGTTPVFADEYTPGGVLVQSIALPTAASGNNKALLAGGTAGSEGLPARSLDGNSIFLTGYSVATAAATAPSGTTSAANPRTVGRINAAGVIDTTTALTDLASASNVRSAVSADGITFYAGGGTGGVRFATIGATTSVQLTTTLANQPTTTLANTRQLNIFGGNLYASAAPATGTRLYQFSGLPTSGTQNPTAVPGIPATVSSNAVYNQFVFLDLSPDVPGVDTLYVADAVSGIQKFSLVNGSYVLNGTITAAAVVGLVASVSGNTVSLFGTAPTRLFTTTDTAGYNAPPSSTTTTAPASALANTNFRGLAFAPGVPAPAGVNGFAVSGTSLYSFSAASPGTPTLVGDIGFAPEGIDFNPATGELFALDVGVSSSLYTLNLTTGAPTLVGNFATSGTAGANSYDLTGQQIGFDFNPKTLQGDGSIRIRVTAKNGSDIRLNSANGAVAAIDGALLTGTTSTSVVGSAYTNNIAQMGGATTLYDVSDTTDTLYIQNPPNNGTLNAVGALGIDLKADAGFDIFTGASGTGNTAFLATDADGSAGAELYTVNLAAGTVSAAGNFGTLAVSDIAIQPLAAGDSVPFVRSITRATGVSNPTAASSVAFTVTFSKPVTGVDAADFVVTTTGGTSGASVTNVTGSGATYTVTVGGFGGGGTLRLDVVDDDSIVDGATPANPLGGVGAANGSFNTGEVITIVATSGAVISEFRFHGATGAADEYVELLNITGAPLNISGWSIQTRTATGLQTTTVPANTVIPTFGHFLFTGAGYSLTGYGASNASIAADMLDSSGVALFNAAGTLQDAVGFVASDAALREGAGLPAYPTANGEYTFMRDFIVSQSKNTSDSSNDFVFVSTTGTGVAGETAPGTAATVAAQLGAPSPEGLTSPNYFNNQTISTLLDPSVASGVAPNRARITGGGTLGTLIVRRTIKNNTSVPITRLRLSVTSITSLNSAGFGNSAQADVRLVSGGGETGVLLANGTTMVDTEGTTLEAGTGQPQQPLGGGLGSSINFPSVTLGAPLMPGQSRNYNFRLQIERGGSYFIALNILALTQ